MIYKLNPPYYFSLSWVFDFAFSSLCFSFSLINFPFHPNFGMCVELFLHSPPKNPLLSSAGLGLLPLGEICPVRVTIDFFPLKLSQLYSHLAISTPLPYHFTNTTLPPSHFCLTQSIINSVAERSKPQI